MQDQPIVSIIGPTAVGKTKLALAVAKAAIAAGFFKGVDIISADSRQIYQGLEVITGADIPLDFHQCSQQKLPFPFFVTDDKKIALHGIAIVKPDEEWSVSHFQQFAQTVIQTAREQRHLPLIVGGTGLYHRHLFNPDQHLHVGPDETTRAQVEELSLTELQDWAKQVNPDRWDHLNHSDRHNPRRLVRLIELSTANQQSVVGENTTAGIHKQVLIGLTTSLETIKQHIVQRVVERFEQGAVAEVKALLEHGQVDQLPVASTLGVPEMYQYVRGELTQSECMQLWSLHEFQYAKRQLTWWKKQPVQWFDVSDPHWLATAQRAVTDLVDPAKSD